MADVLPGIPTQDKYVPACTLGPTRAVKQLTFAGVGEPFTVRLYIYPDGDHTQNPVAEGIERPYPAGSSDGFVNCAGAEFRSTVAGSPAQIYGQLSYGLEDPVSLGPQLTSQVTVQPVINRVTSLPGAPTDLQQVMLDLDNPPGTWPGVEWLCTYNASTGYWDVIGADLFKEVTAQQSTGSGTYVDLGTPGPSITLPTFGGSGLLDGLVRWGATSRSDTVNADALVAVGLGTTANDANAAIHVAGAAQNEYPPGMRSRFYAGLTAGEVLKLQYRGDGGGDTATFINRWISYQPRRIK